MLTQLGLTTTVTRTGDTNDRMDAKILGEFGIIPIEIKSPTETEKINVKSIRQALENKIVLLSRYSDYGTSKEVTTLAIGFLNPNPRSDVTELIEDIHNAFNINVGILSITEIMELLMEKLIGGNDFVQRLASFRGMLNEEGL